MGHSSSLISSLVHVMPLFFMALKASTLRFTGPGLHHSSPYLSVEVYIDRTRSRDRVKLSSQTFSSPGAIKSTLPDLFVYIWFVPCAARDSFTVPQADQVALRPSTAASPRSRH
ncbi:unnamed protein product, partial [Mesorhabditis spiculigera]